MLKTTDENNSEEINQKEVIETTTVVYNMYLFEWRKNFEHSIIAGEFTGDNLM